MEFVIIVPRTGSTDDELAVIAEARVVVGPFATMEAATDYMFEQKPCVAGIIRRLHAPPDDVEKLEDIEKLEDETDE